MDHPEAAAGESRVTTPLLHRRAFEYEHLSSRLIGCERRAQRGISGPDDDDIPVGHGFLQQVRVAIEQLRAEGLYDLAQITLMSDGASVYLCTSNDEVIDLLSRGQGVFGIAVGKVVREVESSLIDMSTEQIDPNDEVTLRRIRKIG
jgi:hypothetical protein